MFNIIEIIKYLKNLWLERDNRLVIKNTSYSYKTINNIKEIKFINRDILTSINLLSKLMSIDLTTIPLERHMLPEEPHICTLSRWCTDNGRVISDLDSKIHDWYVLSTKLKDTCKRLETLKKGNTIISFNLRKLQPYIINTEQTINLLKE